MQIALDQVKALRQLTGAGVMDCKKALEEAGGDISKAELILKAKGAASVARKAGSVTREGVIDSYIHSGSRIGAMVELNCETDFVARTSEFRELAHQLSLQVAAMNPLYIDRSDMPSEDARDPEEVCLLQQPYIKDPTKVVQELITELAARVGENVRVRRFERFALGE
ncbi:MAG: elongation factor Ts [Chloroflexi bacterium]|nr:elongation factor Ts [Chloroflexota bacterium]